MKGRVMSVWEKCAEDPICCCAENSMEEASVEVQILSDTTHTPTAIGYFAEDELAMVSLGEVESQRSVGEY
eukprot:764329-Hanusia_phi.AAC.2